MPASSSATRHPTVPGDGAVGDGTLKNQRPDGIAAIEINSNSRYGVQVIGIGNVSFIGDSTGPTVTVNGNRQAALTSTKKRTAAPTISTGSCSTTR